MSSSTKFLYQDLIQMLYYCTFFNIVCLDLQCHEKLGELFEEKTLYMQI